MARKTTCRSNNGQTQRNTKGMPSVRKEISTHLKYARNQVWIMWEQKDHRTHKEKGGNQVKMPKVMRIRARDGLLLVQVPENKKLKKLLLATAKLARAEDRREVQNGGSN